MVRKTTRVLGFDKECVFVSFYKTERTKRNTTSCAPYKREKIVSSTIIMFCPVNLDNTNLRKQTNVNLLWSRATLIVTEKGSTKIDFNKFARDNFGFLKFTVFFVPLGTVFHAVWRMHFMLHVFTTFMLNAFLFINHAPLFYAVSVLANEFKQTTVAAEAFFSCLRVAEAFRNSDSAKIVLNTYLSQ